jgi:flagellar capping protein FliD
MANLFNIGGGSSNSQLDQLVAAYRSTQQPQVTRLEQQKAKLEKSSSYYNNLNSRLNSIITQLDKFDTDDVEDKFTTKKVSSSASEYATASANGEAVDGVNTLKVKRLASADMLISSQLNSTDN